MSTVIIMVAMNDLAWRVSQSSQLAVLLEVSAPKPGNVNRGVGFSDIDYRHFLASATLIGKGIHHAASQGVLLSSGVIEPQEVQLGRLILETTTNVFTDGNRHNTILGTILLHVPLAAAMAASISDSGTLVVSLAEKYLGDIINSTTVEDTVSFYRALHLVNPRGDRHKTLESWTKQHSRYDLENPDVYENIQADKMRLGHLFQISARVDRICREWTEQYHSTFFETLPFLRERMHGLSTAEEAIVDTFIWRLSLEPDSHIIKRAGMEAALDVQRSATQILHEELKSIDQIQHLDRMLRARGNLLNPGTTADLVSAAVFVRLLELEYVK